MKEPQTDVYLNVAPSTLQPVSIAPAALDLQLELEKQPVARPGFKGDSSLLTNQLVISTL